MEYFGMRAGLLQKPKLIWTMLIMSSGICILITSWYNRECTTNPALPYPSPNLYYKADSLRTNDINAVSHSSFYLHATRRSNIEIWQEIDQTGKQMSEKEFGESEPEGHVITLAPQDELPAEIKSGKVYEKVEISGWSIPQRYQEGQKKRAFKANKWNKTHTGVKNINQCIDICSNDKSAVALFKNTVNDGVCLCQDYYTGQWSFQEKDSFQVSINYNLNRLLEHRRRGCKCVTKNCIELSCSPKSIDYWIGPPVDMLNRYLTSNLRSCTQKSYSVELIVNKRSSHQESLFCIPQNDWRGFWPLQDDSWLMFKVSQIYRVSCENCTGIPVVMKPKQDQRRILIAAYWRSGSTVSSELFARINDSMFIFEPLKYQGSFRFMSESNDKKAAEYVLRGLQDLYNCHFHALPSETFNFFEQARVLSKICRDLGPTNILDCLSALRSQCAFADHITIKSIRTKLSIVNQMMPQFPNLKGILVIRDPRAMLYSWSQQRRDAKSSNGTMENTFTADNYIHSGKKLCSEQLKDIQTYKKLSSDYPGQFYMYHYEDLVRNSTNIVQHAYQHLNLGNAPHNIVNALYNLTHGIESTRFHARLERYSTFRTDSEKAAHKWKNALSFSLVQRIDEVCKDSYQETGYQMVPSERELHNENNHHRVIDVD